MAVLTERVYSRVRVVCGRRCAIVLAPISLHGAAYTSLTLTTILTLTTPLEALEPLD